MKLATLKNHTRDGELIIVNRALTYATRVPTIAKTMQAALDHWQECEPKLQAIYHALNDEKLTDKFPFHVQDVMAPLPRAYQWVDGSAYVTHVELVRKARGAVMPPDFWSDPLMYQGCSDSMMGCCDDILVADEAYGIDFEAEIAVITNDVPMGCLPGAAEQHILLLMLVNDVSLRNLIPAELSKGFGFLQSKPASSFSPVAITPDELTTFWDGKRVHLPLQSYLNDMLFGQPNAGIDMTFDFPTLISHAAKTRRLCAGTIVGSGTVSNADHGVGSSCIIERRMLETLNFGTPKTPFMRFGDHVRIDMLDDQHHTIFGAISQKVEPLRG